MSRILLIEPAYKNKYPPLGLMKIAAYHRVKGDHVIFYKGLSADLRAQKWDRIYLATLFTFYWKQTVKTIKYYINSVSQPTDFYVGGVMATLMKDELLEEVDVNLISGLLNKPGILGKDKLVIDGMIPDYSILKQTDYIYPTGDSYIGYATRGCTNRCSFCAVHKIEPKYQSYLPLKRQIEGIKKLYGEKKDLLLLDNNVLASCDFERIIEDIIDLGFEKGAKFKNRMRFVDFNQGTDARLLTKKKMALLSKIAIRPLRIAYDHISLTDIYKEKIELASRYGIKHLSNFMLYNYKDSPLDFYRRLKVNIELNDKLGTKIYSFPMKYIPLTAKDRTYIGSQWTKKSIRTIQSILLATHGMVTPKRDFFEAAFGRNQEEFKALLMMPEKYIINRKKHSMNGALDWRKNVDGMTRTERRELTLYIQSNKVIKEDIAKASSRRVKATLEHYL